MLPDKCEGCNHASNTWFVFDADCNVYADKAYCQHTRMGGCAMRTHNRTTAKEEVIKVNPLKQSKRSMGK